MFCCCRWFGWWLIFFVPFSLHLFLYWMFLCIEALASISFPWLLQLYAPCCSGPNMIVVHVDVAVRLENQNILCMDIWFCPVFQHAYLTCPMLCVNICTSRTGIMRKHKDDPRQSVLQWKGQLQKGILLSALDNREIKRLSKQSGSFVSTLGLSDNDDCVANSFSLSDSCVYTCKDV